MTEHRAVERMPSDTSRALQAVNILRNRFEDVRGVDFFPDGWTGDDFRFYTRRNLSRGDVYVERDFLLGLLERFVVARGSSLTQPWMPWIAANQT